MSYKLHSDEMLDDHASRMILLLAIAHSETGPQHITNLHFNEFSAWYTCSHSPCGVFVSLQCDRFK